VEARPIPGLEHLPFAEVWLHEAGEERRREASAAAAALGKTGLEVWTTTRTPDVVSFLLARGFEEHRRYAISRLDVAAAPDPGEPAVPLVTLGERSDLADELYALARVAHADQPGRDGTRVGESWYAWGLRAPCPDAYFIALDDRGGVAGYGYLEEQDGTWRHGFTAVARAHRGRGIAGAIKRAQIRFAKQNGIAALETANELRVPLLGLSRRLGYEHLCDEVVLRGPA
jgi:GNAT superfamily N-acetyltransferase